MSRLPTPGSDNGTWGAILNDFLQQTHEPTGELKSGSVSNAALQDGSVTAAKIAGGTPASGQALTYNGTNLTWAASDPTMGGDLTGPASNAQIAAASVGTAQLASGSVTADKLASGLGTTTNTGLRPLLVFYSPPNIMNGRFSDDYAAGVLSRYGDVILPDGLYDSGHQYHASTQAIIQKLSALDTDTVLWGYIDLGVTNGATNTPIATLKTRVDAWIAMGVQGIFCDLVGYDYGVTRARQNEMITYIHGKGLPAFLNVWNSDDLLSSAVNATYNPTGTPTVANSSDAMMLESWICNTDAYSSPYFAQFTEIKERGDKAVAYRTSMGIRLYALSIYGYTGKTDSELKQLYDYTNAFARIWRLDGSGLGASNYSSTGNDLGKIKPFFSDLRSTPLRPTAGYSLNNTWTQTDATDLGLTVMYDPVNTVYTWSQD